MDAFCTLVILALLASLVLLLIIGLATIAVEAESERTSHIHQDIRQTGWQARRAIDQTSDEFLRQVWEQDRR